MIELRETAVVVGRQPAASGRKAAAGGGRRMVVDGVAGGRWRAGGCE